jgi:hypothetical protein
MARKHSAGVDCVGFVKRSANYGGLQYGFPVADDERDTIDNDAPFNSNYGTIALADSSWEICTVSSTSIPIEINLVVPGDVVTMDGHLAMINKIIYYSNTRTSDTDMIYYIEATTWPPYWMVQNTKKMINHINDSGFFNFLIRVIFFSSFFRFSCLTGNY